MHEKDSSRRALESLCAAGASVPKALGVRPNVPALLGWERRRLLLARFRAGTAQTQFPFLHPASAAALLVKGCPIPQPPTASLS